MTVYLQNSLPSDRPKRDFNLRRYFSYFSISIIIAVTALLSALVYWNQRTTLIEYSISSAADFAKQLNAHLYSDYIKENIRKYGQLNIDEETDARNKLDGIAKMYISNYRDIQKVKIFNMERKIIYSTDTKDLGIVSESESLTKALTGRVHGNLVMRETVFPEDSSNRGKKYTVDLLEVYVPIYKDASAPQQSEIVGVFEIYKDASSLFALMRKEFYKVPLLLIFSMSLLYLFLQFVIKKANAIINKQNEEIDLHSAELAEAQKRIGKAIDDVIANEDFRVRLQCDNLLKCWEVKDCKQIGCPSYRAENLRCWQVSGTFCGGRVQGFFAQKYGDCRQCEIYQNAFKDRIGLIGESFNNMMALLENKHSEMKKLNDKLNIMIDTDPLTEAGNRRSFQKRIESIHLLALRYNHPYSIIICDVDNFKTYNDTYGHQKGDYALVSIANTMKTSIRRTDEMFRWGGEEFIIVLPEQNLQSAVRVAETLRRSVEALGIPHLISSSGVLTISVGVACNIAENIKFISWENVIKQADDELYRAKGAGKNCVFPTVRISNNPEDKP